MPYPMFDRSKLILKPLAERVSDLDLSVMVYPDTIYERVDQPDLDILAERVVSAYRIGAPVILMMGAHVIRKGNAPLLIDLMERKIVSHIALNGAGSIHDFELALTGHSSESVAISRRGSLGCGMRPAGLTTRWWLPRGMALGMVRRLGA